MSETDRMTGGEAAVRMLQAHGVTPLFGLCGDTRPPTTRWYGSITALRTS